MSDESARWLIVGLGNPGSRYRHTRHNIGFWVVEALAAQLRASWKPSARFRGRLAQGKLSGQPLLLLEPETYMNLSGESVAPLAHCYQVPVEEIIAVHDDVDLEPGRLKLKQGGGDGGHKGIRSMTELLGSPNFLRLRFGVGRPSTPGPEVADFVLSSFEPDEQEIVTEAVERSVKALQAIVGQGLKEAMNRFNRPPKPKKSKEEVADRGEREGPEGANEEVDDEGGKALEKPR